MVKLRFMYKTLTGVIEVELAASTLRFVVNLSNNKRTKQVSKVLALKFESHLSKDK